jgi:hypothetical protein
MADNNGAGVGIGMIAGILLVVLVGLGIILFAGGYIGGGKNVNVTVEPPKIQTPATGGAGK